MVINENQQQKNKTTNNITHKMPLKLFIIRMIKKIMQVKTTYKINREH